MPRNSRSRAGSPTAWPRNAKSAGTSITSRSTSFAMEHPTPSTASNARSTSSRRRASTVAARSSGTGSKRTARSIVARIARARAASPPSRTTPSDTGGSNATIWTSGEPEREERHAPPQERDAAQRARRQGRSREESQAGDRDRALGSEKEGGQSPAPAPLALTLDTAYAGAYAGAFLLRAPRHFSFSRLVDG